MIRMKKTFFILLMICVTISLDNAYAQPSSQSQQMQQDYEYCSGHANYNTARLGGTERMKAYMYFYNGCMTGRGYDMTGGGSSGSTSSSPQQQRRPVKQQPPTISRPAPTRQAAPKQPKRDFDLY